jgi:hypothetical protein
MEVDFLHHEYVCLSVRLSATNNFWTAWYIFMKFGTDVMTFKGTSMQ